MHHWQGPSVRGVGMLRQGIIVLLLALVTGCGSEMLTGFRDMFEIRKAVLGITDADDVGLGIHNGTALGITIANSSLNADTPQSRRQLANRVARIAHAQYSHRDSLDSIRVAFVAHEDKYLVVSMTATVDAFCYAPERVPTRLADASMQGSGIRAVC